MKKTVWGIGLAAVLSVGCHTITEELPTQPSDPKGTVLKIPIPAIPGATPTPTPTPKPTPTVVPAAIKSPAAAVVAVALGPLPGVPVVGTSPLTLVATPPSQLFSG